MKAVFASWDQLEKKKKKVQTKLWVLSWVYPFTTQELKFIRKSLKINQNAAGFNPAITAVSC